MVMSNNGNNSDATNQSSSTSKHARSDSAARRHSIQPILSGGEANFSLASLSQGISNGSFDVNAYLQAQGDQSMSEEFDFMQSFTNEGQTQGDGSDANADSFLSPPRLTVSLPNQSEQQAEPDNFSAESPKRLRLAPESDSNVPMSRSAGQSPSMPPPPSVLLETPQRQPHIQSFLPNGHRNSDASTMTPFSDTTSSALESLMGSVSSTASDRNDRRFSIDNQGGSPGRDRLAQHANMLGISGAVQNVWDYPDLPKSAPPTSAFNAMQRAQSASRNEMVNREASNKTGKGADVWPDDVEVAFWEALRLIPKLGRRKVLVSGKPCGRNELIADYIRRKTGKLRTRKQVSSHIQVLKNVKKEDMEFQSLIAEPVHESDFFLPAGGPQYSQNLAGFNYGGLGGPNANFVDSDQIQGLQSPYSPFANSLPLPPASPLDFAGDYNNPPLSAGLSTAFGNMGLPSPGVRSSSSAACPILPSTFSMGLSCTDAADVHYYSKLDYESMAPFSQAEACLPRIPLKADRLGAHRFPRLQEMFARMPCQFLHVSVPMAIPRQDILLPKFDRLTTQLSLTSQSDKPLISVTTVYSFGKVVLSLYETLEAARPIAGVKSGRKSGGETPTPRHPSTGSSPQPSQIKEESTPGADLSENDSPTKSSGSSPTKHMYCYQAPFATDFWADFLSRQHPVQWHRNARQAFCKEPSERAALGMAVGGITVVQEFVVANSNRAGNAMVNDHGCLSEEALGPAFISPGSSMGDVVLVIAWDLECVEKLGGQPGKPIVSHICEPQRRNISPMMGGQQMLGVPPQQQFAGYSMSSPQVHRTQMLQSSPLASTTPLSPLMQGPPRPTFNGQNSSASLGPSLLRKRGLSGAKAHLMLNIPPASTHLNPNRTLDASPRSAQPSPGAMAWGSMQRHAMMGLNSPITPATSMAGTPLAPPPLPTEEESKAHRDRLTRAWAADASMGHQDFHSPLVGTFQLPRGDGSEGEMLAAARNSAAQGYPHLQNNQPQSHHAQQLQQLQQFQQSQQQQQQQPAYFGALQNGSLGLSFDADRSVAGGGVPPDMPFSGSDITNFSNNPALEEETRAFVNNLLMENC